MQFKKTASFTLKEGVFLVLAALLILATFKFYGRIQAAFFPDKDDGSKANFENLYGTVKELIDAKNQKNYKIINYYLSNGNILVGFDANWDDSAKVLVQTGFDLNLYRPYKCGSSACMCLYTTDWEPQNGGKRDQGVLACYSSIFSGKKVIFSSSYGSGAIKQDGTQNIIFYGDPYLGSGDEFGTKRVYIEKSYDPDSQLYKIYISPIDEKNPNDPANTRKITIDNLKS